MESTVDVPQQARQLLAEGRVAEAEALCRRAVQAAPDFADGWNLLGVARCLQGDPLDGVAALKRAVSLCPEDGWFQLHLGNAWHSAGRLHEAARAYRAAIACAPSLVAAHAQLGAVLLKIARQDQQLAIDMVNTPGLGIAALPRLRQVLGASTEGDGIAALRRAVELAPHDLTLHRALAAALESANEVEAAVAQCRAGLALAPADESLTYLLGRLTGEGPAAAPCAEVRRRYDAAADVYDALVGGMEYAAPAAIADVLAGLAGSERPGWDVLDLGCGTGLCAPVLRPLAASLAGVDLSPRMLDHARARGLYDALTEADLRDALTAAAPDAHDLIVAADVFVYLGDLAPTVSAAARALGPGGRLVFTTEAGEGAEYKLQRSGRYQHAAPYLRSLAEQHGLAVERLDEIGLRSDGETKVCGYLAVLRRP